MSRKLLGISAIVLLVMGCMAAFNGPGGNTATGFGAGCIRVGLVLGALWLALPQIQATLARAPRWVLGWFVGRGGTKEQETRERQPGPEVKRLRPRRRGG